MPIEIRMPELSSDMTEADLVSWLVAPGDKVRKGDLICELETEKSTVEYESPLDGILLEILVPEGTNGVETGTVIAVFDAASDAAFSQTQEPQTPEPQTQEPGTEKSDAEPSEAKGGVQPAGDTPAKPAAEPAPAAVTRPDRRASQGEVSATALARRVAEQSGVPLSDVAGSGPGGRIVKADVQAAALSEPARNPKLSFETDTPHTAIKLSRMRRTIATRLAQSKQTIPHFYLRVECEIDRLIELRAQLNADDRRISINDFVVRAAALALVEVPDANVSYTDEALIRYDRVDVAVAVATEGGLVTPLVRDADRKELEALSETLRDLAIRAREGKLTPKEYQGGSFTVSNLGMYGVESVYPIINPPQSCILGVGAGEQKPVVRDGVLAVGTVMSCTLSADHRAVDGAIGAQLLSAIKRRLEDPLEMLL